MWNKEILYLAKIFNNKGSLMKLKTVCLQKLKTERGVSVYRAVNFMLKKIRKCSIILLH